MTYQQTGAQTTPRSRGKGFLITGVVLLVIGLVAVVVGIILTTRAASAVLHNGRIAAAQTAPATLTSQLDGGTTYAVYEATDGTNGSTTVQPADITVTGPSGTVTLGRTNGTVKTTGADDKIYAEVATFDAPAAGSYTVAVATNGSLVAVAPALSTAAKGVAWIVAIILGSLVAIAGVVLIIIGAARRSSSRAQPPAARGGPAAPAPSV